MGHVLIHKDGSKLKAAEIRAREKAEDKAMADKLAAAKKNSEEKAAE